MSDTEPLALPGPGDLLCILSRFRTHVGDLVITAVDNPVDPVWGTH